MLDSHITRMKSVAQELINDDGSLALLVAVTDDGLELVDLAPDGMWHEADMKADLDNMNALAYFLLSNNVVFALSDEYDSDAPPDDSGGCVQIVGVEKHKEGRMWEAKVEDTPTGRTLREWQEVEVSFEFEIPNDW